MAKSCFDMCDMEMKGYLSFMMLWLLSKQAMSGSQLADELARRRGGPRPNPGTIYPALKVLRIRRAVIVHVEGRQKVYKLTDYGQQELDRNVQQFCKMFYDVFAQE
ncbi:MAG: PadR family transcriptional regulator [Candidatus Burarchaeum sp.]|nr:PadR family transcriptional regulator [Candidatus Burarchaeum sp.]MDO8339194.1 PadR family transcriptional regulator [Candidatus Burarchaeum sp.]